MSIFPMRSGWVLALATSCSSAPPAPRVKAQPPSPPPPPACPTCCKESDLVIEVDPASTLGFIPYGCWLKLEGRYAMEEALPDPPAPAFDLFCREGTDEALRIQYRGALVGHEPITDLVDPYDTGGRENPNTVTYSLGAPMNARYKFESGELRFQRPPRAPLNGGDAPSQPDDGRGDYVELGLDLRFEGDRRLRAALRICPTYAHYGPVADPVE